MVKVGEPYCHIELTTKGGEHRTYDMQIESVEKFDFDRWFAKGYLHEPMFHVPGYTEYLAFDSILRIDHETYSGIPF